MQGIENKRICLCLNKSWQPIGIKSVRDAFSELVNPFCQALNIVYKTNEDSSLDYSQIENIEVLTWLDWINLPVRDCDFSIRTPNLEIRVPTILIASRYKEVPLKTFKLNSNSIFLRDGGVCQYSGKKIDRKDGSIDHVMPKSRGGKDTWDNMVWCDKKINSKKGQNTPEEAGLTLQKKPEKMDPVPFSSYINFNGHVDWGIILNK